MPGEFEFAVSGTVTSEAVLTDSAGDSWIVLAGRELGGACVAEIGVANGDDVQSLSAFKVEGLTNAGGTAFTLLSGTDYSTPTDTLLRCTTAIPSTLAAGGYSAFELYLGGLYAIRFSAAGTASPVTVKGRVVRA